MPINNNSSRYSTNTIRLLILLSIALLVAVLSGCFASSDPGPTNSMGPMGLAGKYSQEAEANFALARVLWKDGTSCSDPIKAIEYLNKAIDLEPDYAEAYLRRGMARSEISSWKMAEDDLTQAIRLQPTSEAYAYRGLAFMRSGNLLGARKDLEKSIEMQPGQHRAWNFRGALNLLDENVKQACSDFRKGCSNGDCTGYDSAKEYGYCK